MAEEEDFLDEMVAEFAGQNPEFPRLLDEAVACRKLVRDRARECDAEHPPVSAHE